MAAKEWTFLLDEKGIQECIDTLKQDVDERYPKFPHRKEFITAIERILHNMQTHFGDKEDFKLSVGERFSKINFQISIRGDCYDPRIIAHPDNGYDEFAADFLEKYDGAAPTFQYKNGVNIVSGSQKKKRQISQLLKIIIGLAAGVLLAAIGLAFPMAFRENISIILNAINEVVMDLIVMSATVVVFLMVISSISGLGSIASVKKSGGCLIKSYLLHYLLATILIAAYLILVFDFNVSLGAEGSSLISELTETIAGIFPSSYVTPFAECDFLQIIFVAAVVGFAMLVLGDAAEPFRKLCNSMETISNKIMSWFCALMPLFVFTMVPSLVWDGQLDAFADALLQLLGMTVVMLINFIIGFLYMCCKIKQSPAKVMRLIAPSMIQGFVTSSSTSALNQIKEGIRSFGVKKSFSSFSTAMGFIFVYMSCYISFYIMTFSLMISADIQITVSVLISLIIASVLFSIAGPPVSGGAVAVAIILAQMYGVPDSYLGIVTPIILIADFITTGLRCGNIIIHSVLSAAKMGEIEQIKEIKEIK